MPRLIRIVVIVIVVLAVGYGVWRFLATGTATLVPKGDSAAGKGYSAVFLVNDQVYFGKLSTAGKNLVLTDVYYIRLNQTDQTQKDQTQPQLSLVKLGDQIHGPVDEMRINGDQVLFVERIKDDSTVVKGILQDKEKRASGQNETPASNAPAADTPSDSSAPAATDQKK